MTDKAEVPSRVRKRVKRKTNQASVTVSKIKKVSGNVVESSEKVDHFPFYSELIDPAYINVNMRVTKQPVQFESVQVGVSITVPCKPNEKAMREAFEKITEMGEQFIGEEMEQAGIKG